MKAFVAFLVLAIAALQCEAKVYNKCEFAKTLLQAGFPKDQIGTWSCIAEHESHYNTKAINHSSGDYGILQISKLYWCNEGNTPGKGCGITCNSLLGDDIFGDLTCVKKVFEETKKFKANGFEAWTTYGSCRGDQSRYVAGCF
ncbi:unnamed protein product [Brassicogethes aeneus]|uniref:lysozyme n=1 Tax=Brassicogethes aeneus TaxID=1431903 RepID=A0A9P0F9F6_BRAAE|nr:unnamed protein product [Brassicogethes aeneus]